MADAKKKVTSISFEDFTEQALGAVGRQLIEFRDTDHPLFNNPHITMGIIWRPDWVEPGEIGNIGKK